MNYSSAILLINSAARAVLVSYEPDTPTIKQPRTLFKTMDPAIKPGDLVVVETNTRHNMTVCRVEEVDVEVDFESGAHVGWIISPVDLAAYQKLRNMEAEGIQAIKSAEVRRKRDDLREKLLADNDALRNLPIANATGGALPAPPPPPFTEAGTVEDLEPL